MSPTTRQSRWRWRRWRAPTSAGGRGAPGRHVAPLDEVEHEATLTLLAAAAGVRVPRVLLARAFGNGAGLLVEERIDGRSLDRRGDEPLPEAQRADVWRQVAALHHA